MKKIFYFITAIILLFIAINLCIVSEIDYSTDNLKNYCKQHSLSQNYAALVDFSKHSGTYRFFVIDLNRDKVIAKSLCALMEQVIVQQVHLLSVTKSVQIHLAWDILRLQASLK